MPAAVSDGDMQRRRLLCGLAGLFGTGLAGCTGNNREVPATAPEPPEGVEGSGDGSGGGGGGGDGNAGGDDSLPVEVQGPPGFSESEDGYAVVSATVKNEGLTEQLVYLQAAVRVGDQRTEFGTFVRLVPGEERAVSIVTNVPYEDFSGVDFTVLDRTPETPVPTASPTPTDGGSGTTTGDGTATATGTAGTDTQSGTASAGDSTTDAGTGG